jgi:hypothetical protein
VGFLALRRRGSEGAYAWQKETISPLGLAEGNRPGALFLFEGVWVNNQKSGTTTELGKITRVGGTPTPQGLMGSHGIALNSKGQVALSVQFDNGPDRLVLLTPAAP